MGDVDTGSRRLVDQAVVDGFGYEWPVAGGRRPAPLRYATSQVLAVLVYLPVAAAPLRRAPRARR